jgi:hypothetical protein
MKTFPPLSNKRTPIEHPQKAVRPNSNMVRFVLLPFDASQPCESSGFNKKARKTRNAPKGCK